MSTPDVQQAIDLIEEGQPADALDVLQALVQRWPAYAAAHVLLARTYEALARWEDALGAWQRAYFLMPNSPAVREGVRRTLEARLEPPSSSLEAAADLETDDPATPERLDEAPSSLVVEETKPESDEAIETGEGEAFDLALAEAPQVYAEVPADEDEAAPEDGWIVEPTIDEATLGSVDDHEQDTIWMPESASGTEETPATESEHWDIDEATFFAIERLIDEKLAHDAGEPVVMEENSDAIHEETFIFPEQTPWGPPEGVDDLDRLIDELESARITPRADFESIPPPEMEDEIEDMVSETLARIYASQGQYDQAARVYEQLAIQQPEQSIAFLQKAAEMRARADGDEGE